MHAGSELGWLVSEAGGHDTTARRGGNNRRDSLSAETVHDLRASLTVIKAQAQMVRRWLRRNDVEGSDVATTRLAAAIDSVVDRLCDRLSDLDEPPPQDEPGPSSNGRSGR